MGEAVLPAVEDDGVRSKPHALPRGGGGGGPGSVELVAVHEVGAHLEMGGQVEDEVLQRRVLEQLRLGQGRLAAGTVLAAAEAAVQVQHHVAEHIAEEEQAQEVVAEELEVRGLCNRRTVRIVRFKLACWLSQTTNRFRSDLKVNQSSSPWIELFEFCYW